MAGSSSNNNYNFEGIFPAAYGSQLSFDISTTPVDSLDIYEFINVSPIISRAHPLPPDSVTSTPMSWRADFTNEAGHSIDCWSDSTTISDGSTASTPFPPTDKEVNNDSPFRPAPPEPVKNTQAGVPRRAAKRKRSDDALEHARNRQDGACLWCQMRTNKHACQRGPDFDGPCPLLEQRKDWVQ